MNRPKTILRIATLFLLFLSFFLTTSALRDNSSTEQEQHPEENEQIELFQRYYANMQVDSAIATLNRLIDIRHKRGDLEEEAKARWNKLVVLNNSAHYDSLLVEAHIQREWFKENSLWSEYYKAWQRICSANHDLGRIQIALREARTMSDDAQKRNDFMGRAMAYKQMGIIYYDLNEPNLAAEAFKHSIALLKKDDEKSGVMSTVYDGYCQALDKQKKYKEELIVANKWLEHLKVVLGAHTIINVAPPYVTAHLANASAYIGLEQLEQAKAAIKDARHYYDICQSSLSLLYIYEMEARMNLAQGKYMQAVSYTDSIFSLGITVEDKVRTLRAEALLKSGAGNEAAILYKEICERKDSIFNHDLRTQLNEMSTLFHINEMKKDQQRSNVIYTVFIASLIVFALILYILLRRREAKRLEKKNQELALKNADLIKANARAEESTQMKTDFIKNISHEIRTPLNILNGFTQILTTPDVEISNEEREDIRHRIEENAERITELVNKILELSEASSQQVIDCNDKVTAMQIALEASSRCSSLKEYFTMEAQPDVQGVMLSTNEHYATRALSQLVDNAMKFHKKDLKSHIVLRLEADPASPFIRFIVEDDGIGIPASEAEHIFHEFVQLDEKYDGTGIGLTVARSIVRRIGGDIVLDNDYKKGARFIMTRPR